MAFLPIRARDVPVAHRRRRRRFQGILCQRPSRGFISRFPVPSHADCPILPVPAPAPRPASPPSVSPHAKMMGRLEGADWRCKEHRVMVALASAPESQCLFKSRRANHCLPWLLSHRPCVRREEAREALDFMRGQRRRLVLIGQLPGTASPCKPVRWISFHTALGM